MADASLHLEGGNNITLSTATAASVSSVTISGPNTHAVQTGISSIVGSDATYTSGSVQFTGSNMITVKSSANQRIVIDATQTVQSQGILSIGVSTGGNSSGDTTVNTGSRLVFAGGNNITVSQGTAGGATTITISGPNVGGAQTGISSIAASNTTYTSGMVVFTGSNMITVKSSGAGQTVILDATQSVQTQGITGDQLSAGVSTGGNTAGNTTVNSGSRLVFVGTDNISLSQGTAAGATTISIRDMFSTATSVSSVSSANAVGANNSRFALEAHIHEGVRRLGISTQGNTAGTTGINPGSNMVFAAIGDLTLSQNTDAALNNTLTISAPAQTIQTATTVSSVSSANAVGANNSRFAMEAHIHEGVRRFGISTQGNTGGTTGILPGSNIQLVGSNMISLSQSTDAQSNNTITINATQTVQTQGITGDQLSVGVSTGGNTAGNTTVNSGSRLVFSGQSNITLSQATAAGATTIGISAPDAGAGGGASMGVSTGGNTEGNTTVNTGNRLVFVGSNMVTLSQATGAGSTTITFKATQTNQSAIKALGASNTGNTAGNTGVSTGIDWVIAGTDNLTVSESTVGGGPNTLWLSGPSPAAGTVMSIGVSSGGNTEGNTTVNAGSRFVLVGSNMITISQATGANSTTVTIKATQTVQTQNRFNLSLSTASNGSTSGTMAEISSGTLTLYAGNLINLSQSGTNNVTISGIDRSLVLTGWNGDTLSSSSNGLTTTVSIGPELRSFWHNNPDSATTQTVQVSQSTSAIGPFFLPYPVSASFVRIPLTLATSTASTTIGTTANTTVTASMVSTHRFVIYQQNTGASSMSLASVTSGEASFAQKYTAQAGANGSEWAVSLGLTYPTEGGNANLQTAYSASTSHISFRSNELTNFTGIRFMDMSFEGSLEAGPYWIMYGVSTTLATQVANMSVVSKQQLLMSNIFAPRTNLTAGNFGSTTHASIQMLPGIGSFTTAGGGTTASLGFSNVSSWSSHRGPLFAFHRTA